MLQLVCDASLRRDATGRYMCVTVSMVTAVAVVRGHGEGGWEGGGEDRRVGGV